MPAVPRDLSQAQVVSALVRAGGVELKNRGKGSHRLIKMPNIDRPVVVPSKIKTGLTAAIIKQAGLSLDEFREAL